MISIIVSLTDRNLLELLDYGIGDFQILFFCASADSDCPDNFAVVNQWESSGDKGYAGVAGVHAHHIASVGNERNKVCGRSPGDGRGIGLVGHQCGA